MKHNFKHIVMLISLLLNMAVSAQERPYINEIEKLDFGELTGFVGSCSLDYVTKIITDKGGDLCPFSQVIYGEPGEYLIIGNSNTEVNITVSSRNGDTDRIAYAPSGIYSVFGEDDITIIADTEQTIPTGDTGVITIYLGGTLTVTQSQALNSTYNLSIPQGITFNEVP